MSSFPEPADNERRFRWQALFGQTTEPLFLLNPRRRILFVNHAWETLTGVPLSDVKGQACRRRPRGILVEKIDLLLGAMAPPAETMDGQPAQTRRLVSLSSAPACWQISFFPLAGSAGLAGILGKISVPAQPMPSAGPPLSERLLALRERHLRRYHLEELASEVPAVVRLHAQVLLASQTRLPALIVGPPGSGKQWVARAIHYAGPEREQTFACLDCARLTPDRLAELLFASAPATPLASVYLKNLAGLPLNLQVRLQQKLEVSEAGSTRILAGLDEDPAESVRSGKLLNDLYCRLSPILLRVPALHERMDDFDATLERLLPRACQAAEPTVLSVSAEALLLLRAYAWPGNLRELYDVLLQAALRAKHANRGRRFAFLSAAWAPPRGKTDRA